MDNKSYIEVANFQVSSPYANRSLTAVIQTHVVAVIYEWPEVTIKWNVCFVINDRTDCIRIDTI